MSRFIFILVFLIWLACPAKLEHDISRHLPLQLGTFAVGYALLIAGLTVWGKRLAARTQQPEAAIRAKRFHRMLDASRWIILAWFTLGTYWLGWKTLVDHLLQNSFAQRHELQFPSLVIGCLPAFAAWLGLWFAQYAVDAARLRQNVLFDPPANPPPPPPLRDYLRTHMRLQLLLIVAPMLILVLLRDVLITTLDAILARLMQSPPSHDTLEMAIAIPSVTAMLLFGPELLRRVLKTRPLPASPLRQRLETLCQQHHIGYADVLLWQTSHQMANALVMGLVARWRYILISDLLLDRLTDDQVAAVFAHEMGHVKHHHLYWLAACVIGVVLTCSLAADWIGNHYPRIGDSDIGQVLVLLPLGVAIFGLVFGYVSRQIERQADVFAARALAGTVGQPVDAANAAIFAAALQRVALLNDINLDARSWDHGSVTSRLDFLHALAQTPDATAGYDRAMRRFYRLAAAGLAVVAIALAVYAWLG